MDSSDLPLPLFFGHPYYSALAIPIYSAGQHEVLVKSSEGEEQNRFVIGM